MEKICLPSQVYERQERIHTVRMCINTFYFSNSCLGPFGPGNTLTVLCLEKACVMSSLLAAGQA